MAQMSIRLSRSRMKRASSWRCDLYVCSIGCKFEELVVKFRHHLLATGCVINAFGLVFPLPTRRSAYSAEAARFFKGAMIVSDDGETLPL